jgi:hypothetical protein
MNPIRPDHKTNHPDGQHAKGNLAHRERHVGSRQQLAKFLIHAKAVRDPPHQGKALALLFAALVAPHFDVVGEAVLAQPLLHRVALRQKARHGHEEAEHSQTDTDGDNRCFKHG